MDMAEDLLELLSSTPLVEGTEIDLFDEDGYGENLAQRFGGHGSDGEVEQLRSVRSMLQRAVRIGDVAPGLETLLAQVVWRPAGLSLEGLGWQLDGPAVSLPAARAIITWADLSANRPGRLRQCENPDCHRFLFDRSKANSARWCSMAVCGNRLKARRHYARRAEPGDASRV
jgi:predicted RNA-binding Zn ribbon-like protein